jgi:DNA/RNA endonuclease G (NUC1)
LHCFFRTESLKEDWDASTDDNERHVSVIVGARSDSTTTRRPLVSIPSRFWKLSTDLQSDNSVSLAWGKSQEKKQRHVSPRSFQEVGDQKFQFVVLAYNSVLKPASLADARPILQNFVSELPNPGKDARKCSTM